jgi:hypothetical protein
VICAVGRQHDLLRVERLHPVRPRPDRAGV